MSTFWKAPGRHRDRIEFVRWGIWLGLPVWTVSAWGAGDFLGAKACAECHAEQARRQAGTHHARALRPILGSELPAILTDRPIRERDGDARRPARGGAAGVCVRGGPARRNARGTGGWPLP